MTDDVTGRKTQAERDDDVSRANGGIVRIDGSMVVFGNGRAAWAVSEKAARELHRAVPARGMSGR